MHAQGPASGHPPGRSDETAEHATESPTRRSYFGAAFALAAVLIVAIPVLTSRVTNVAEGERHEFIIPAGTAARISKGEDVTILPEELDLELRDRLILVNRDVATHHVAGFVIGPDERVDARFSDAISVSGSCSLHPSGRIEIRVHDLTTGTDRD